MSKKSKKKNKKNNNQKNKQKNKDVWDTDVIGWIIVIIGTACAMLYYNGFEVASYLGIGESWVYVYQFIVDVLLFIFWFSLGACLLWVVWYVWHGMKQNKVERTTKQIWKTIILSVFLIGLSILPLFYAWSIVNDSWAYYTNF